MIEPTVGHKEQQENSLKVAYKKAAERLRSLDPDEVCTHTGALYDEDLYTVRFLERSYEISLPRVEFRDKIPLILQVLILHYLTAEHKEVVSTELINFSSIPGGMFYFESFKRRVLDKLVREFGETPELLLKASENVGGGRWEMGNGYLIHLFPRIDAVVQVYPEDEEFPAAANFLFSGNVGSYLPIEDIAFMGGYAVSSLSRAG